MYLGFFNKIVMTLAASGNVGVGTLVPSANVHVLGNVYVSNAVTTTNVFATQYTGSITGWNQYFTRNLGNPTTSFYVLLKNTATSGSVIGRIFGRRFVSGARTGNISEVVIENTTGGNSNYSLRATSSNTFQTSELVSVVYNTATYIALYVYTSASVDYASIFFEGYETTPNDDILLTTTVTSSTPLSSSQSNYYILNSSVGIGTNSPSSSLEVTGNVYSSNALTTTNVFATTVSATNPISFRNRVINGDFLIDQRNSGASSTPAAGVTRTIDRWKTEIFGSGRCLVGQNLGGFALPAGFSNCYGMKVTTTTSVGASDYFFLSQVIEGVNTIDWQWGTASARPITLSFWVFSSIAGTAGGFFRNAGSSASNYTRSYPFTFTITNTLTWEYKTVTIPGDTGTPWYTTQTDGVEFGIKLWNGTTYQSAPGAWAAGNFTGPSGSAINYAGTLNSVMNLTGVQIELGSVATQYERRLYNFEFDACQRYYETTTVRVGGYNTVNAYLRGSVYFNTKKRTFPLPDPPTDNLKVLSTPTPETSNVGTLNFDGSYFDGSSARYLVKLTSTGDAYGQWRVAIDCEF